MKISTFAAIALAGTIASVATAQPFTFMDTADINMGVTDGVESLSIFSGTSINTPGPFSPPIGQATNLNGVEINTNAVIVRSGAAGSGANGGTVYAITFDAVSFTFSPGPFGGLTIATDELVPAGTTLPGGGTASMATIQAGLGGNGLDFSSVYGAFTTGLIIESSEAEVYTVGNEVASLTGVGIDNGDLSVGWDVNYDFGTDIAAEQFAGFRLRMRVEVIPAPATASLLGLGGLVAARRRRA